MLIIHKGIKFSFEENTLKVEGKNEWQEISLAIDEVDVILTIQEYVEDLEHLASKLEK